MTALTSTWWSGAPYCTALHTSTLQCTLYSGSAWNPGFRRLCGINPDQHFYLHLDTQREFQHIDFTVTTVAAGVPYKFGLWITQVSESNNTI